MHAAEAFDPADGQWTTWASMAQPRIYHSTAILLPDGRVLVAGGENKHIGGGERNYEIFSPPYLFQGSRPQITTAPTAVGYGTDFVVFTPDAASVAQAVLIRPASVTHNFDQNQRYVPLSFIETAGSLELSAPADGNVAPPGYYMLFLVDGAGVPSAASFVRLGDGISAAGAVPDGTAASGPQLTLIRSATPSDLDLSWGASCTVTDPDYVVYEGTLGEFSSEGYDICSTPRCQVYGGMIAEHPFSDRAIEETAGQVVLFGDVPAETFYGSTCGGHTENVEVVFPLKSGD